MTRNPPPPTRSSTPTTTARRPARQRSSRLTSSSVPTAQTRALPRPWRPANTTTPSPSRSASRSTTRRWPSTRTWPRCMLAMTCLRTSTAGCSPSTTTLASAPAPLSTAPPSRSTRLPSASALARRSRAARSSRSRPTPSLSTTAPSACSTASPVGDAAGYVTKCSGEGIYFAAKSGRMAAEAMVKLSKGGSVLPTQSEIEDAYLAPYDRLYGPTYAVLDVLQQLFYRSNPAREAFVEMCASEYVQQVTFDSYLYKKVTSGGPIEDMKLLFNTVSNLVYQNSRDDVPKDRTFSNPVESLARLGSK